jgi:hypothetical protein
LREKEQKEDMVKMIIIVIRMYSIHYSNLRIRRFDN